MRGGSKTLIVALAALLIAVGLAACGGGDSSSSTSGAAQGQTESKSSQEASKQDSASDEGKSGSDSEGQAGSSSPSASDFTPKHHSDSGGGSAPYRTKGGDNSVQEFGEEAGTAEFEAAAASLHNFLDARSEGNWAAACDYMAKSIIESFEKLAAQTEQVKDESCAGILEKLTNPNATAALDTEAEKANVRSLRVDGEQAFVIYTGPHGAVLAMPMASESRGWKVASLAGTPLN